MEAQLERMRRSQYEAERAGRLGPADVGVNSSSIRSPLLLSPPIREENEGIEAGIMSVGTLAMEPNGVCVCCCLATAKVVVGGGGAGRRLDLPATP